MEKYDTYEEIQTNEMALEEGVAVTLGRREEILSFFREAQASDVVFAGATSPHYAGQVASMFWRTELGLNTLAVPGSELVLFPDLYYPFLGPRPVMFAVTRTGRTTETIWTAGEFEKRYPGRTVLVSCSGEGPLAEQAALKLAFPKSAEKSVPQTRSLGTMILSMMMSACFLSGNEAGVETLKTAPQAAGEMIRRSEAAVQALFKGKQFRNVFFLGGGMLFPIAREGQIMCLEMANIEAISYQLMESRHGPRSLMDENTLVVGLYSRGGRQYEADALEEYTQKNGATTLAIVPEDSWNAGKVTQVVSAGRNWPDAFLTLTYLPVVQLVSYYAALSKGVNPDTPRMHTHVVKIERH